MQYGKIDAALAASLTQRSSEPLAVFVSLRDPCTQDAARILREHGIEPAAGQRTVTTSIAPEVIARLSELQCVRSIRLSGSSGLL